MEELKEDLYDCIRLANEEWSEKLISEIESTQHLNLVLSVFKESRMTTNVVEKRVNATRSLSTYVLSLFQVALYIMYVLLNLDRGLVYASAKGFGINIRIITILLFFSMMRTTLGNLSFIYPKVNENTIAIHAFLGKCLGFHSIGHTICHIINGLSLNLTVITGFVLFVVMTLIVSISIFRKRNYKIFEYTHMLYVIWIPLCIIHTLVIPGMYLYFTIVGSCFVLERIYDLCFKTTWYSFVNSKIYDEKTAYICCPREHSTYPGSYYRLKVPSLSPFWHPYSLSGSTTSKYLKFFVESTGDWTANLYNLINNGKNKHTTIAIQGPFISPSRSVFDNPKKKNLLIATGIGITPFFSILTTKISHDTHLEFDKELFNELFDEKIQVRLQGSNLIEYMMSGVGEPSGTDELNPLYCVWSIRNPDSLSFYLKYLDLLIKYSPKTIIYLDIYVTKNTSLLDQIRLILSLKKEYLSLNIYFKRPNIERIIERYNPDSIYYCGSPSLKEAIQSEIADKTISFFCESFD